jgi:DNA helicase HerA-like ATPase
MALLNPESPSTSPAASRASEAGHEILGRVIAVSGAQVTVGLSTTRPSGDRRATVGKFLGIVSGGTVTVGMITEIAERRLGDPDSGCSSSAQMDLVGEIKINAAGNACFERGINEYPMIGEPAVLMGDRELRLIYNGFNAKPSHVGVLQQDRTIPARVDVDQLVSKHFAVLGTTGVGKTSGVILLLQQILEERPDLRIFLIDPHNEYSRCFGDRAQVLTPRNLRLPFWLFNFEETIDAFFGARPGVAEEVEILSEAIPLAKAAYVQLRGGSDRSLVKRKDVRSLGYGADTPVPYRIEDLITAIDESMGKLENRGTRAAHQRLLQRIQTFRNHPRYGFMFENATVGGDTMADVVSSLFRLPADGVPMTIMQLAGFPAEVVDSVVSVLSRMAFDFGLWSDGAAPLLFVCEEAHRYAPADKSIGFGPTRRALSRIAKEGRKYGVFLGLVTQRPAEIDATILSQCSTMFVMRLANDRDQALIRSAVSDAGASMLTFIPSLGIGEVFAFGAGVPLPTRMKFRELPPALQPMNDVNGGARAAAGTPVDRDMVASVIERWRSSTMSNKSQHDDDASELGSWREDPAAAPAYTPPIQPSRDSQRPGILRRPITADMPASLSNRYR